MANKVLVLQDGKAVTVEGSANGQVLTWSEDTDTASFQAAGGGGGSGTVTSVGLTGGTSGIVIGGTASPITTSGTYTLDAPLKFTLNSTSPSAVSAAGDIAWNDTEGSIDSMLKGGNVVLSVGQQVYQRVVNADSVELTKGMVVYVFGSSGTRISVKRARADADLTSAAILGVVAESIAVSASGFVMTSGLMKDLSVLKPADGFDNGEVVYLSPSTLGALTTTKPVAPQHLVTVGYVAKSSAGSSGELLVHPQNGYEIEELHDVLVTNPASGELLIYDNTTGQKVWKNASLTAGANVSITNGAGSVTVAANIPYDLAGEFVGTPADGATIMRFVAVRTFTLSDAVVARFNCTTGPTSTATFTVNVNGTSKGTVTIATSGTSGTGTLTSTSVAAGDVVTVVATTPAAIVDVWFTLPGVM